jgi:hypothetical protein
MVRYHIDLMVVMLGFGLLMAPDFTLFTRVDMQRNIIEPDGQKAGLGGYSVSTG